jgi:hypothetical protein
MRRQRLVTGREEQIGNVVRADKELAWRWRKQVEVHPIGAKIVELSGPRHRIAAPAHLRKSKT